jgi:hypothetical protein
VSARSGAARLRAALHAGLALVAGCAPVRFVAVARDPAATLFRVESHLAWPHRLRRVIVVVDGALVLDATEPRPDAGLSEVHAQHRLAAGAHVVHILAETPFRGAVGGPDCPLELRPSRSFAIRGGASAVTLDLFTRERTTPFDERLGGAWREEGTYEMAAREVVWRREPSCDALAAVPALVCEAEAALGHAQALDDVAWMLCIRAGLAELRSIDPRAADVTAARRAVGRAKQCGEEGRFLASGRPSTNPCAPARGDADGR